MTTPAPEKSYIPAIDGLRAIAVTLVLMFHAQLFPVGWVGVWIFFVISGFVITNSLMVSEAVKRPLGTAILDFYSKRAFRIIPLYVLILTLATIVNLATGMLRDQLWPELASLATFSFNFYRMIPGYADSPMQGHLWSLSVEEQFYFFFPLLFLLAPRGKLASVLVGVAFACIAVRWGMSALYSNIHSPNPWDTNEAFRGAAIYMFSPGHFDAFAMGGAIALLRPFIIRTRYVLTGMLAVTLIGWALFFAICGRAHGDVLLSLKDNASGGGVEIWRYSLLSLSAATVIVSIVKRVAFATAPLSLAPVVYVGRVSYGVYIFHLPLQFFLTSFIFPGMDLENRVNAAILFAAVFLLTVAVATASFYWFERPMQRLRPRTKSTAAATPPFKASRTA